jgi:Asp-tRNA(Asn)/Glu-tRNA(Gln) amidotransferase A subunit family amidase
MLSALDLARQIETGELTPAAALELCAEAIAAREGEIGAFTVLDLERARRMAEARGAALAAQPLRGLAVGMKDIFDTADFPTQYGSAIYTGHQPKADAAATSMVRRAGGIVLGKTVTTEFAHLDPGKTRNPHNLAHTPGGSSSGSAAGVAAGVLPIALGTQTGGSVIRPAAYCGVVGFKASFGLFPPAGMHVNTESLDTVGIMARSVADIALFRAALMAIPHEPPTMPDRPPRLALCRTPHWDEAQPEGRKALEAAAAHLKAAGAEIVESELPSGCDGVSETQRRHSAFEAPRSHAAELHRHEALLSRELLEGRIAGGRKLSLDDFRTAWRDADRATTCAKRSRRKRRSISADSSPAWPR